MQDLSPSEIEAIVKSLGSSAIESTESIPPSSIARVDIQESSHHPERTGGMPAPISRIQFTQLQEEVNDEPPPILESAQDVKIELHAILGRTKLSLKKLLELHVGSVLPLDKLAGERVDIEANGKLIARGEVVILNNNFGVRITEIPQNSD